MKKYLGMIFFVLILGLVASSILVGVDLLTAERIESNKAIELRRTILDVFDISYERTTINAVFEEKIKVVSKDDYTFYVSAENEVGFEFEGAGLWGPIEGFIAFDENLEVIKKIVVLQQEETPGLGGVVADPEYLMNFEGIKMSPKLEINKDTSPNKENEVDTITGATRTSKAFELILNKEYVEHSNQWSFGEEE